MLFKIYPKIIPSALTVLYLIVVLLLVFSIQISVSFAAVAPPDGNPFSDKYGGVYAKSVINGSMSHVNIDQINILTYPKVFFQNTYGTSGTLVIHASQGASNSQMVVKSVQTGKIVNSFPGRSSLDYRTQKGVFRMIAVEENGWYEITIKDSTYSTIGYYPILLDFLPDDVSAISEFNWFAAALNYEYKRWYTASLVKAVSDNAGVAQQVSNMVLALQVADAAISIGTNALSPTPGDSSLLVLDTNLIKDAAGTRDEINAIRKGVTVAITDPMDLNVGSRVADSVLAIAQCVAGDPLSAYQTIVANFMEAGIWALGVYKLNKVERALNAHILVKGLITQQLNDRNHYQYSDTYVRQQSYEFAEYTESQCGWFEDLAGCGLDNYNEDNVVALYNNTWEQLEGWIIDRKRISNYYPDVDNDGVSNVDEIANGTDPNDANDPPPPPPPGTPYAVITATPGTCKIMETISLSGASSIGGNGQSLQSYAWELVMPSGSSSTLSSTSGVSSSFVPTVEGSYTIKLTIFDGMTLAASSRQIVVTASYPNIVEEFDDDGRHIYIENLNIPECIGQNITQIGSFEVPTGEKWTQIKFAGSQGDIVLIARKNAQPEWRSGYCGAWEFRGEMYDWYKGSKIYTWSDDLVPGDTIYLAAVSYDAINNYSINSKVTVSYDLDGDGVPDYEEDPIGIGNPNEQFDSDNDGIGDNADKFDNDPAASVDSDNDGYPNSWNSGKSAADSTTGLVLDAFATDPAAAVDGDGDGAPDQWNAGKTQADSITGLFLDAFPDDAAASVDSDGDGFPDVWNSGKTQGDSTTGLSLDAIPNDVAASVDSDGDGYPDAWNPGKSASDSTTNLSLDDFPFDPSAAVDSDLDGAPDSWNAGKSASDSNTGLQLDAFPNDTTEQKDSDGDGVGDNADGVPSDPGRTTNSAPVFDLVTNKTIAAGQSEIISITVVDPDGDTLNVEVVAGGNYCTYENGTLTLLADSSVVQFVVRLRATDQHGSFAITSFDIDVTKELISIEIVAPSSVREGGQVAILARAHWGDGSTSVVMPTWSEDSPFCTISGDQLLAAEGASGNAVTLTAVYSHGGITKQASVFLSISTTASNGVSMMAAINLLLLSGSSESSSVVYEEDFSFDPQWVRDCSSNVVNMCTQEWTDGSFFSRVADINANWHCFGVSPSFREVTPDKDFSIKFLFNPVKPDWGQYPGIYFVPGSYSDGEDLRSGGSLHLKDFSLRILWADSVYKKMSLHFFGKSATSATIPASNEWYTVSIEYTASTKTADLIVKRTNGTDFFVQSDLDFSGLIGIGRILTGEIQGAAKYGQYADIRVDDIQVIQ